jgi:uncharacterized protein with PQ loop repeat
MNQEQSTGYYVDVLNMLLFDSALVLFLMVALVVFVVHIAIWSTENKPLIPLFSMDFVFGVAIFFLMVRFSYDDYSDFVEGAYFGIWAISCFSVFSASVYRKVIVMINDRFDLYSMLWKR